MKISVVIPTNRDDLRAIGSLLSYSSFEHPDIEIVICDNSGSIRKKNLLTAAQHKNFRYLTGLSNALDNFSLAIASAKHEYCMFCHDDDFLITSGLSGILEVIRAEPVQGEKSLSGIYIADRTIKNSSHFYNISESDGAIDKISKFMAVGTNFLHFAIVQKQLLQSAFSLIRKFPIPFSFHDQLVSLYVLLSGAHRSIPQFYYIYSLENWRSTNKTYDTYRKYYKSAGLIEDFIDLHYVFQAIEGWGLIRSNNINCDSHTRNEVADLWFTKKFKLFLANRTSKYVESKTLVSREIQSMRKKYVQTVGISPVKLFGETIEILALENQELALKYRDFWLR